MTRNRLQNKKTPEQETREAIKGIRAYEEEAKKKIEDRDMHLQEEAVRMKSNFDRVDFGGDVVSGSVKYVEVLKLACDGDYIDPAVVPEIQKFRQTLENYRATC